MTISVRELRFSLIWLKHLSAQAPLTPLEDREMFKAEFEKARDAAQESPWSPPWRLGREQSFWEYYLYKYKDSPRRLAGALINKHKAWENLLPLRLRSFGRIKISQELAWLAGCPVYIEGYRYSHAIAVVINISIRESNGLPVEEVVDRTIRLRQQENLFKAEWPGAGPASRLSLTELGHTALDRLGSVGQVGEQDDWQPDSFASPFTLATFIDAKGADPFMDPALINEPAYGEFYRALDGLCSGAPEWRLYEPFGENLLLKKTTVPKPPSAPRPPGHIMRGTEAGRAVWFPKYFGEHFHGQERERPVLGSYHRRLTLSSLQVEGLITFLQRGQGFLKSGKMPVDLATRMGWVCQLLGQLYGARGTYRSSSAYEQIDSRKNFINSIRTSLKMNELYA
jgi:hypothetical protein